MDLNEDRQLCLHIAQQTDRLSLQRRGKWGKDGEIGERVMMRKGGGEKRQRQEDKRET